MSLKLTKVQTRRVDVVNPAQLSAINKLAQRSNGRVIKEGMPNHEYAFPLLREMHEVKGIGQGCSQWFLHQYVFARQQCVSSHLVVRVDRCGHHHAVDVGLEECLMIRDSFDRRVTTTDVVSPVRPPFCHDGEVRLRHIVKGPDELRPPVATTNYPYAERPA